MTALLKLISFVGLGLTIIPAFLVYRGALSVDANKMFMVAGMLLWFCTAIFWIKKDAAME